MKRLVTGLLICSLAAATTVIAGDVPGPLHTLTIATNSLEETRLFYETGLGLRIEGPIKVPGYVKDAQRKLWQMPDDLDWSLYLLHRDSVEYAAQIRLLVLDKVMPAIRQSWKPNELGPYTIGFPNRRQEQLDQDMRRLGFGALTAMERSKFESDEGREYDIFETVHTGPDFIAAVGVARGVTEPSIKPVNETGMGGPGYSMMVVEDVDEMAAFMTNVIGYRIKSRRLWKSSGTKGALSRARARGITEISGPVEVASPANGTRRHATLIAPNGVMFELFE